MKQEFMVQIIGIGKTQDMIYVRIQTDNGNLALELTDDLIKSLHALIPLKFPACMCELT